MICAICLGVGVLKKERKDFGYIYWEACPECHGGSQHCCDGLQEQPEYMKFPEGEG